MNCHLYQNERIDDLQLCLEDGSELKIIQNTKKFCFGIDAVLLSDFVKFKPGSIVLDLCCGNGIIPLLLASKSKAERIVGVEIQPCIANMAKRSVFMNNLQNKIEIICCDLRRYREGEFDSIVCNPPYKEVCSGLISSNRELAIARTEICCTLDDVMNTAKNVLKPNGSIFMIHRPQRITDILCTFRKYNIEPKIIRYVHPYMGAAPTMILIKGIKYAKPGIITQPPLYVAGNNKKNDNT